MASEGTGMRAWLATTGLIAAALVGATVVLGAAGFGSSSAQANASQDASRPLLSPETKLHKRRVALRKAKAARKAFRSYRLLDFTGAPMKWGDTRYGRPAEILWRLAEREESFEGARNCRAIAPIGSALASNGLAEADFRSALKSAMSAWEDVAGITFREARDGERAGLVLGAQMEPRGRAFTNVSTLRTDDDQGPRMDRLVRSLVCLNPRRPWKIGFDGDLASYDLRYTLMHELGHVIGLDHTGPRGSIMSFRYDERLSGLAPGDIRGAQRLYGLPAFLRRASR